MDKKNISNIYDRIPITHNFTYKGRTFPFNMDLFNIFSDYFQKDKNKVHNDINIPICDKNTDISEDSVENFIKYCQLQQIEITSENVFALKYLSEKYNVSKLKDEIKEHILHNQKYLVVKLLLKEQIDSNTSQYEDFIANNLLYYINFDEMLSLSIPILHRILSKSQKCNENDIINFLFKLLKKHGRKASVLFDLIDFKEVNSEYIDRIFNEFYNIFDFHFIQPEFLRITYNQQNEIIKKVETIRFKQEKRIEQCEEENKKLKSEVDLLKKQIEKLNSLIISKSDILNLIQKEKKFEVLYDGDPNNRFHGIIHYLTIAFGGNVNDKCIVNVTSSSIWNGNMYPKYAVDLQNFSNVFATLSDENSWLKYDFITNKIRPTCYSIRSRGECLHNNPTSWIIEGSNTDEDNDWKLLDSRSDVKSLLGLNHVDTFDITTHLEPFESFRFLRIRSHGILVFSTLEYFGDFFK